MSGAEITRIKKVLVDLETRIETLETSIAVLVKKANESPQSADEKYNNMIESIKSLTGVQTHAILEQIRSEIRMEFYKIQRDLQRDLRGAKI